MDTVRTSCMNFTTAELGEMKAVVDSMSNSRTRTEHSKNARLLASFITQMGRVRGWAPMKNVKLTKYSFEYDLAEDDGMYTLVFSYSPKESRNKNEQD